MPWCRGARDNPFSLAVGSKEAGATAETARGRAADGPACRSTQPVCHRAAVLMRPTRIPVQHLKTALCVFHHADGWGVEPPDVSALSQHTVHPAEDTSWLCTLDTPNSLWTGFLCALCSCGSKDLPSSCKMKSGRVGSHPALSAAADCYAHAHFRAGHLGSSQHLGKPQAGVAERYEPRMTLLLSKR